MDVVKLDSNFLPTSLVEDYSSMVWTERFVNPGDFEMHTSKISETRELIPEGSFISLVDSREVMMVETHTINFDDDRGTELVVQGRTFETFLEGRIAKAAAMAYRQPWTTLKNYKIADILSLILWNWLVNSSGQDVSRDGVIKDVEDVIANLVVTDSSTTADSPISWSLQEGEIYSQLNDILALGINGIRGIRPPKTSGSVVSFDTSGGITRGDISKTVISDISDMRLDVYNGLDRTYFQSDREPVIFHFDSGDIDDPSYLFSIKNLKTSAVVGSDIGNTEVWPNTGTTPPGVLPAGLDRRVLYLDGGTQGDTDLGVFTQTLIQKGLAELAKHNRTVLFDGAISLVSQYKYGEHYGLGDIVSLIAQYGFKAEMMVAEYVRTEDINGDRGYPTLVLAI